MIARKISKFVFMGLIFLMLAGAAEIKLCTGNADDKTPPEIVSLFIAGFDINDISNQLKVNRDQLVADEIIIKGYAEPSSTTRAPLTIAKISLDGGQTWEEVPIDGGSFVYGFTPREGERYAPLFKVRDSEGMESSERDLPQFTIIYKPIRTEEEMSQTLAQMIDQYENKNLPGFMKWVSDSFQGDVITLEEAVEKDFITYSNIDIDTTVQKVTQSGGETKIEFRFNWRGVRISDGQLINPPQGTAVYTFKEESEGYKLLSMSRPIIFGVTSASQIATGASLNIVDNAGSVLTREDTSQALPIKNAIIPILSGITFSTGIVAAIPAGDVQYWTPAPPIRTSAGTQINLIATSDSLENHTTVPNTGWVTSMAAVTAGDIIGVSINSGSNFAIFEVVTFNANNLTIRYKYQPDGSRNVP